MTVKNALVFSSNGKFIKRDVFTNNEYIADSSDDNCIVDGDGFYLIPGLIDIHFHGCLGYDFCDASIDSLTKIGEYQLKHGITSICPASLTLPEDKLSAICSNAADYHNRWKPDKTAQLIAINLEGPFICAKKKGAQNGKYIIEPDMQMFERLLKISGNLVKLTTIAPEIVGAMEFIKKFSHSVRISVGHTNCDYQTAKTAFDTGAGHITHLYNAMPVFSHRAAGPIGAGMDCAHVTAEIICDTVHISPPAVRAAFLMFGDDRLVFISDSMAAAGMDDGEYLLGELKVTVKNKLATLVDNTIAGSTDNLMDCMRKAVLQMDIPLESAVKCSSVNPAKVIGMDNMYGSIQTGKYADMVLLDKKTLMPKTVISHGKIAVKN